MDLVGALGYVGTDNRYYHPYMLDHLEPLPWGSSLAEEHTFRNEISLPMLKKEGLNLLHPR